MKGATFYGTVIQKALSRPFNTPPQSNTKPPSSPRSTSTKGLTHELKWRKRLAASQWAWRPPCPSDPLR